MIKTFQSLGNHCFHPRWFCLLFAILFSSLILNSFLQSLLSLLQSVFQAYMCNLDHAMVCNCLFSKILNSEIQISYFAYNNLTHFHKHTERFALPLHPHLKTHPQTPLTLLSISLTHTPCILQPTLSMWAEHFWPFYFCLWGKKKMQLQFFLSCSCCLQIPSLKMYLSST